MLWIATQTEVDNEDDEDGGGQLTVDSIDTELQWRPLPSSGPTAASSGHPRRKDSAKTAGRGGRGRSPVPLNRRLPRESRAIKIRSGDLCR